MPNDGFADMVLFGLGGDEPASYWVRKDGAAIMYIRSLMGTGNYGSGHRNEGTVLARRHLIDAEISANIAIHASGTQRLSVPYPDMGKLYTSLEEVNRMIAEGLGGAHFSPSGL